MPFYACYSFDFVGNNLKGKERKGAYISGLRENQLVCR